MSDLVKFTDIWSWKKLFFGYFFVYASFAISASIFSNWRFFPSVDLSVFPENWGKFIFYTLFVSLPYLFLAQVVAAYSNIRFKIRWSYLADIVFVILFLIGPISLIAKVLFGGSHSTVSFGVREGEIIRNGVVTDLGHHYFFMLKMKEVLQMAIYLGLRFLAGLSPFVRFFKYN